MWISVRLNVSLLSSIINVRCSSIVTNVGNVFIVVASFRGADFLV
jgi:hypothetical protein